MTVTSQPDGNQEVVIAVMGATGSGKSTFIQLVTQREDVQVGDTLCSETSEVSAYDFFHEGTKYTLVDTPGFDDTSRPDSEITESILTWCRDSLVSGQRLNGVIYIHRISDPRMAGSALRNVRIFRKLVGVDAFSNVVLATTFWEQVQYGVAEDREGELRANPDFWGAMTEKGAKMARLHYNNRAEGVGILGEIAAKSKVVLKAQDELVNEGKAITETDAAIEQKKQQEQFIRDLEARRQAEKEQLEKETEERARHAGEERLKMRREMDRKLREEREATERENRLAIENYERRRQQLEDEYRQQEERRRRDRERVEREKEAEQERQKRIYEEMKREQREREEELRRERRVLQLRRRYRHRKCIPEWPCDSCGKEVTRTRYYYHCCLCDDDRYFHCGKCGDDCGRKSHPYMEKFKSLD